MRFARGLVAVLAVSVAACAAPTASAPPVAWRDWSPAAFEEARRDGRLIVVHVEAVWCHWCHVMLDETYGDGRVRAAVAADYLPIRVDSDARPDVAERYRDWGWPATAILTPDARGVVSLQGYQEPDAFAALLAKTAADVRAGRTVAAPPRTAPPPAAAADLAALRDTVAAHLDGFYDEELAGWGRRQKYLLAPPVEHAFLRAALRGEALWRDRALATLDAAARLIDPVWGGMYQYSVPVSWDRPHFEKIVPVQAAAIECYAGAFAATRDPRWSAHAGRVRGYVAAFLTEEDGAWRTSQDADVGSHAEDGIPFVDGHEYFPLDDAARRARGIPRIDRNVYADRNGMGIAALCALHDATGDADALRDAVRAAERILRTHADPGGGFRHAERDAPGGVLHLADQVEMGRAFLRLHESTGDARWLAAARALAGRTLTRFAAPDGGWFGHTEDASAVGEFAERRRPFRENGRAARFLLHLARVTEDDGFRADAERAVRAIGAREVWSEEGRDVGDLLLALEELTTPAVRIAVVGPRDDAATAGLHRAALALPVPVRVVERLEPGVKYAKPGVYVCTSRTCAGPFPSTATLADDVARTLAAGR